MTSNEYKLFHMLMQEHKRHNENIERIFKQLRTLQQTAKASLDLPEMVKYIRFPESVQYDPHLLIGTSYEVIDKDEPESFEPYIQVKVGNRVCARPAYCFKSLI